MHVGIDELQACFPALVIMCGNSYYVRLDPSFVRFWELEAGDEILITLTKAKRERMRGGEGKHFLFSLRPNIQLVDSFSIG